MSSYRGLHLLVRCSEGPLNFGERGFKTIANSSPAMDMEGFACAAAQVGDSLIFPAGTCFFPACRMPVCWESKRNSLIYMQRAGASGCPGSQAPVAPGGPLPGDTALWDSRGGQDAAMGQELEIKGWAGSQPSAASCDTPFKTILKRFLRFSCWFALCLLRSLVFFPFVEDLGLGHWTSWGVFTVRIWHWSLSAVTPPSWSGVAAG